MAIFAFFRNDNDKMLALIHKEQLNALAIHAGDLYMHGAYIPYRDGA